MVSHEDPIGDMHLEHVLDEAERKSVGQAAENAEDAREETLSKDARVRIDDMLTKINNATNSGVADPMSVLSVEELAFLNAAREAETRNVPLAQIQKEKHERLRAEQELVEAERKAAMMKTLSGALADAAHLASYVDTVEVRDLAEVRRMLSEANVAAGELGTVLRAVDNLRTNLPRVMEQINAMLKETGDIKDPTTRDAYGRAK